MMMSRTATACKEVVRINESTYAKHVYEEAMSVGMKLRLMACNLADVWLYVFDELLTHQQHFAPDDACS